MKQSEQLHLSGADASEREREDRVVAHLRRHGAFGGVNVPAPGDANQGTRPALRRWRVPMIAAAAAVVLGVLSVIADRSRRAEPPVVTAEAPQLLIWY
jgi:anti-sigma-K factor RskA